MKEFKDERGATWTADVREREDGDYKGRFYLFLSPEGASNAGVVLEDIRWNSLGTAERTLTTMSGVELRRRLRSALGRAGVARSLAE